MFAGQGGRILAANESFLSLVDAAHEVSVKNANFADFLQRGSVDVKVMMENTARDGRLRNYATQVIGAFGKPVPVDVSVSRISAGKDNLFAFVLRESSGLKTPSDLAIAADEAAVRSMKELVGQASLKEIVAETTNVVEKMCIETAAELTMHNRVSTAEMLGLSRQSLYVKLRKYGLLARDTDEDTDPGSA